MKKILILLIFSTFYQQTFSKTTLHTNKSSATKGVKLTKIKKSEKLITVCSVNGTVFGEVWHMDCGDGSTASYVTVGIIWEIICINFGGIPVLWLIVPDSVETSPVDGGC